MVLMNKNNIDYKILGSNIKLYMDIVGIDEQRICKEAQISSETFKRLLIGLSIPNTHKLILKINRVLNVSSAFYFYNKNTPLSVEDIQDLIIYKKTFKNHKIHSEIISFQEMKNVLEL